MEFNEFNLIPNFDTLYITPKVRTKSRSKKTQRTRTPLKRTTPLSRKLTRKSKSITLLTLPKSRSSRSYANNRSKQKVLKFSRSIKKLQKQYNDKTTYSKPYFNSSLSKTLEQNL